MSITDAVTIPRARSGQADFRRRHRARSRTAVNPAAVTNLDETASAPVAGIVDVLDNHAFIRTSGYSPGPDDVYVSLAQVRKYGLRRGDLVVGATSPGARAARDGERHRGQYRPLAQLDAVNGMDLDAARRRPEFYSLTPLFRRNGCGWRPIRMT
jgi:transcription termination factor Rho